MSMIMQGYKDYLESEEWKKRKQTRKKYDNNRCQNCGQSLNLQVHHTTYDNLYDEDVKKDLKTLCVDCHRKRTQIDRKRRKTITDIS